MLYVRFYMTILKDCKSLSYCNNDPRLRTCLVIFGGTLHEKMLTGICVRIITSSRSSSFSKLSNCYHWSDEDSSDLWHFVHRYHIGC